jgi:hypothetical protein
MKAFYPPLAVLATLATLATIFWAPTLFNGQVLVHGDSVMHGLALWDYYSQSINQLGNLLWNRNTFGGHPLFAEGQGAFAFPLNALLAHIMNPIYANSFAHWVHMILAGVAVYGLSRTLRLSSWASGFAALATVFSSTWLAYYQNLTISVSAMCVPWFLWAAECWFQRPGRRTSILFGLVAALTVFAGYPHHLQGVIVYFAVSLLPNLLERKSRSELIEKLSLLLKTGFLAIAIGMGIAAVQLLPLFELVQYSHRAAGATPYFFDEPLDHYIRGFLYNLRAHEYDISNFIPSIGSFLVILAFTLTIFFKLPTRIKGHFAATLLLLNLAMGATSPITAFLYNWHLIPGMHYFRYMIPYLIIAAVGAGVVAGFSIDRLTAALSGVDGGRIKNYFLGVQGIFAAVVFVSFWTFCLYRVGIPEPEGAIHVAFSVGAIVVVALLAVGKRAALIPMLLFFVLAFEVASMKLDEYVFVSPSVLRKPETVKVIERDDPYKDYKVFSASNAFFYLLGSPHQKDLAKNVETLMANLVGLSNLRWNVPSMMGSLALPLRENVFIHPTIEQEVRGIAKAPVGLRLIDILSVKYIAADEALDAPGFNLKLHDPSANAWLMENSAAKPRFQVYTNYDFAESSEEALAMLQSTKVPLLVLQATDFMTPKSRTPLSPLNSDGGQGEKDIHFELKKDTFTHYELAVTATEPGWLFLADSNYPGWQAFIDGNETPVYTAQILGKAIFVPKGDHDVELVFTSASFHLGLRLTLAAIAAVMIFWLMSIAFRMRYTPDHIEREVPSADVKFRSNR